MGSNDLSVLQPYCENDMRLLKRMSRSIFMKFNEPLSNADYDEFYSVANMTLWQAYNSYNPDMGISFDGFLRTCLDKKFKSELERRHRKKRTLDRLAVSLDSLNANDEECDMLDFIPSDFDTFNEAMKRQDKGQYQDKVRKYISRLSNQQVSILNLLVDGYEPKEIRQMLGISEKEYAGNMQMIRSYENVRVLF